MADLNKKKDIDSQKSGINNKAACELVRNGGAYVIDLGDLCDANETVCWQPVV